MLAALSAAVILAAGAPSDPDAIRLVNERAGVEGCQFLEQLHSKSHWGGFGMTGVAYNNAMKALKKKAAKLGATHVLLVNGSNSMGGTNMIGDAYRCEAPAS
jgi:hypothetical protein